VVVTLNLYGDIISDVAAEIAGSVGLAGSANIGDEYAMFEAIHGSAPDIAGQGIANPSGLLNGACMMLVHIGQTDIAEKIQNALLKTIEDGLHTADIYSDKMSEERCNTNEFADAIIERLGSRPMQFAPIEYDKSTIGQVAKVSSRIQCPIPKSRELVGVDVYLFEKRMKPDEIAVKIAPALPEGLMLKIITNRGVKVWPDGFPETQCADHWRCRVMAKEIGTKLTNKDVLLILEKFSSVGLEFIKIDNLYHFDGERAFSLAQGE